MDSEGYHYIVYRTTNTKTGKFYVGFHKTRDLDDGYLGSGKLIRKAIEKYGPEVFSREILKEFDDQKSAEDYERSIVNEEFVQDDKNYNLALGGNVRAMPGKSNPFYGKTHSRESRDKIALKATGRVYETRRTRVSIKGEVVSGLEAAYQKLGLDTNRRNKLIEMCGDPSIEDVYFVDELAQEAALKFFLRLIDARNKKSEILSECAKERFTGIKKSQEHCKKISDALMGKSRENPQNKDPEKIRKTSEKHRGMKRSEESRLKMAISAKNRKRNK